MGRILATGLVSALLVISNANEFQDLYVYITPTYFRKYLSYLWNKLQHPILVSEFGFPKWKESEKELSDQRFDSTRSTYYLPYMSKILRAVHEDGVHVMGALAWSYTDNWEFGRPGHFGLQSAEFKSQEQFYKKSFFELIDFVKARQR